jgi:hypothetical protein
VKVDTKRAFGSDRPSHPLLVPGWNQFLAETHDSQDPDSACLRGVKASAVVMTNGS